MSSPVLEAKHLVATASPAIDLAIVIPTYNERDNIRVLVDRLTRVLDGISWEAIFVDDDSPDGTADEIRSIAAANRSVRLIHRIGRRGLASASVEGMLSTCADAIAVMDADLQHDESILPIMLESLRGDNLDLVVGTRNALGGCKGEFAKQRVVLSNVGARLSDLVCKTRLSDPMSGFFMLSRSYLQEVVRRLSITGFKILVDLVASADRELRVLEVPYKFRKRKHGESKLDVSVGLEYVYLLIEKLTRGWIPVRFAMFLLVGGIGLVVHMAALSVFFLLLHTQFIVGQMLATLTAMTGNFFLNNAITFRDAKLRGWALPKGLVAFYLTCSLGAATNITVAQYIFARSWPWALAAVAGLIVSSVWNFVGSSLFTWQRKTG
jgi:dolichol-phosphate mannosyltransferase